MTTALVSRLRRPQILTGAGLALGVLGAGLVLASVRSVESRAHDGGASVAVLVAARDMPAGTAADAAVGAVRQEQIPKRYARPGALADLSAVRGQVTVGRVASGEQLAVSDFAAAGGTRGHLPIPTGREAVAIGVTLDGGVARWPAPGDRVNVFATFKDGTARTTKILSDIAVLATDSGAAANSAAPRTESVYLLAVTPDEAVRLVFAKQTGAVWLSLVPEGQQSPPVPDVTGAAR